MIYRKLYDDNAFDSSNHNMRFIRLFGIMSIEVGRSIVISSGHFQLDTQFGRLQHIPLLENVMVDYLNDNIQLQSFIYLFCYSSKYIP